MSQGADWKTVVVAAVYSAKLNSAQWNYPMHEIEMLAGVETMLRHKDVLQGVNFTWVIDHKGLIYLLNQNYVSRWQAHWIEKISSFNFCIEYTAGSENILAGALSRMYSNDSPGMECARSEFTAFNVMDEESLQLASGMVLLAGVDAIVATHHSSRLGNVPGAETGWPETSKEFAQHVHGRFVLCGL